MRFPTAALVGALVASSACTTDGVPPLENPPPGSSDACAQSCGDNDLDSGMPDNGPPPPMTLNGDPIEFISTASDNFGAFFEPVAIEVWDDMVALCTGVRGVAVYRAEDPCCVSNERTYVSSASNRRFPRCQHFARDGFRLFFTNRGDEIQPTPFISAVDIDTGRTLGTLNGDASTSFEAIAINNGVLYAALHEQGMGVYRIEGDANLTEIRRVTDAVENAWKPHIDPGGAFLYLADAQGGVKVYSLADPTNPQLVGQVATEGTTKEVVQIGNVLYAASGVAGVDVIDVSDPANPRFVTRLDTPGSALGVAATAEHLVVADWTAIQLYRLTDPLNPTYLGHQKSYQNNLPNYTGRILDVAIRDNDVFIAEWEHLEAHRITPNTDAADLVVPGFVELPRTDEGRTSQIAVKLENVGTRPLVVSEMIVAPPFSIDQTSLAIEPGARSIVTVTFSPQNDRQATAQLSINSNDPDEPNINVSVRGNLPGLRVGDTVPNITFADLDGIEFDLSTHRGKPVLLAYFATF